MDWRQEGTLDGSVNRELTRLALRLAMVGILVAGCAHNIYHFKTFAEKRQPEPSYNYYNNQYYNNHKYYRD